MLVRTRPFHPVFDQPVDRVFDQLSRSFLTTSRRTPTIDASWTDGWLVLTTDLPEYHLQAGDVGNVILVHRHGGYEVKFATLAGDTVAEVTLSPEQVRPVGHREIAHVRVLPTA